MLLDMVEIVLKRLDVPGQSIDGLTLMAIHGCQLGVHQYYLGWQ